MWYIRVWIGPQSLPPGALVGRFGVTGFLVGGGLRESRYSTLGWAVLLPGREECPYWEDETQHTSIRQDALAELAAIAAAGRYYSATWIYARAIGDIR